MCKSRIFAEVLDIVSRETEVPGEQILSSRKDDETVDARYLLVYYLVKKGFSCPNIARLIHKNARTVTHIITNFSNRGEKRKIFRINSENIGKQMRNN